jgi:hypothetical protein
MKISLIHPFRFTGPWDKLLKGVTTLKEFQNRITSTCKENTAHLSLELAEKRINDFKGDAFEVFVEMLLKSHSYDRRFGVGNYQPLSSSSKDTGVDGTGIGTNNKPATVQIKYRSNPTYELTANDDHLSNFLCASIFKYNVDKDDTHNMWIFTNCTGVNSMTMKEMLYDRVKCLNGKEIAQLVDDNLPFWNAFNEAAAPVVAKQVETVI